MSKIQYSLVIETDAYAGNFEREMFVWITGISTEYMHGWVEETLKLAQKELKMRDDPDSPFYDLIDSRIYDPGDDGFERTNAGVTNLPSGKEYNSVEIYLTRKPNNKELKQLYSRIMSFKLVPSTNKFGQRPNIKSVSVMTATVVHTFEEVP